MTENPQLKTLECYNDPLTELDLSGNPLLSSLSCGSGRLTELDLSHNPNLISFTYLGGNIGELDVTHAAGLQSLICVGSKISSLDPVSYTHLDVYKRQVPMIAYFIRNTSFYFIDQDKHTTCALFIQGIFRKEERGKMCIRDSLHTGEPKLVHIIHEYDAVVHDDAREDEEAEQRDHAEVRTREKQGQKPARERKREREQNDERRL